MKRLPLLLLAFVLAFSLIGCTTPVAVVTPPPSTKAPAPTPSPEPKELSMGAFNGNTYTNDFFGMSFTIPDEFVVATKEEMEANLQMSEELFDLSGEDLAKEKSFYFTFVSKYPYGTQDVFNSNMNAMCINLGLSGFLLNTTSEDCLKATKDQLNSSNLAYTFGDITSETINGTEFSAMDATLSYQGLTIYQRIFCTLKSGYALAFTLSWMDDGDLADLQSIVDSISFK